MLNVLMELFIDFIKHHPTYQKEHHNWSIVKGKNRQAVVFYHEGYPEIEKSLALYTHTSAFNYSCVFDFIEKESISISCRKNLFDSGASIEREFHHYLYLLQLKGELPLIVLPFYNKIKLRALLLT